MKSINKKLKGVKKEVKKRYNKPTPKWIKKIGDSLLLVGGGLTALGIAQGNDMLSYICVGCTILGKLITNWFTE